jgi:GNAT superfamily N-acetyltransferase
VAAPRVPAPRDIGKALEHNLWQLWSRFGRGDGCALHATSDAIWFDTPVPSLPYNGVIRFAVPNDSDMRIDAIVAHYERRGVPFLWIVHPSAQPADLSKRLRARGLAEVEACPGMAVALRDLPEPGSPPEGIEIHEVTGSEEMHDFLQLLAWRWAVPVSESLLNVVRAFAVGTAGSPIRAWLARRNGVPVAKILLHLGAGAAGLYGATTRPEARGLGLARLLTLTALAAGRRAGYELGVLHSTSMAIGLYEKLGFRRHGTFRICAPPGTLHF